MGAILSADARQLEAWRTTPATQRTAAVAPPLGMSQRLLWLRIWMPDLQQPALVGYTHDPADEGDDDEILIDHCVVLGTLDLAAVLSDSATDELRRAIRAHYERLALVARY